MFPEPYGRAYVVDVLSGLGTLWSVVHYIVNLDTITETHHRHHFPPTALGGLPSLCSRLSSLACLQRGRERLPWGPENTTTETNGFISQVQVITKGMEEAVS